MLIHYIVLQIVVYGIPHGVPSVGHVRCPTTWITVCITEALPSPTGIGSPESRLEMVISLSSFVAPSSFDNRVIDEGPNIDLD